MTSPDFEADLSFGVGPNADDLRYRTLEKIRELCEFMDVHNEVEFIIEYCANQSAFNSVSGRVETQHDINEQIAFQPYDDPDFVKSSSRNHVYVRISSLRHPRKVDSLRAILKLAANLVHFDEYVTKRDVFYTHRHLFASQRDSDRALDLAVSILRVPRHELHILASARGLCMGAITFFVKGSETGASTVCDMSTQISLIHAVPPSHLSQFQCDIDFVLVLEKETVFHRLATSGFPERARCLLVTGKGYPDLATRQFLYSVSQAFPDLPFVCLVDGDPHGADIFLTYRYGSRGLASEPDCTVTRLRWIGLSLHDACELGVEAARAQPLVDTDRRKLRSVFARCELVHEPQLRHHLEYMADANLKAEIEILYSIGDDAVERYIDSQLNLLTD